MYLGPRGAQHPKKGSQLGVNNTVVRAVSKNKVGILVHSATVRGLAARLPLAYVSSRFQPFLKVNTPWSYAVM